MRLRLLLQASEALQVLALEGCGAERSGAKVHRRRRKTSKLTDGKEPTVPHGIQHEEPNDAEWPRAALLARDGRGTVIGAAAAVAASGVRRHKQTHKVYGHSQWAIGWAKPLQSAAWHFQCDSMYICCMYVRHTHARTHTHTHTQVVPFLTGSAFLGTDQLRSSPHRWSTIQQLQSIAPLCLQYVETHSLMSGATVAHHWLVQTRCAR